jgi:CheY-like chemotaxis protein
LLASSGGVDALSDEARAAVDAVLIKPIREQSLLDAFVRLFGSSAAPSGETPAARGIVPAATRRLHVLVAEDNKINQQLTAMILRSVGHEVDVVENGEQAVEAVGNGAYDVVLMDVQMPVLDGIQATMRIRALPPPASKVAIIAVTAHAMNGAREEYMAMGVDDYVAKPIDARTLLGKLAGFSAPPGVDMGPDDSALDRSQLEALAAHLPADSVRELLVSFCKEIDAQIRSIEALSGAGDLAALAREAHSLAGCSGNFGALKLSRLAREIEAACKNAGGECAGQVVAQLQAAATEASAGLRDWLATEGHPTAAPPVQQNRRSQRLQRKRSARV